MYILGHATGEGTGLWCRSWTSKMLDTGAEAMRMLRDDEHAVAPVVGIALLIAITVILAAVIGSIVFGLSADPGDSPQVSISFTVDGGDVILNHEGGETLDTDQVVIKNEDEVVDELDDVDDIQAGQSVETDAEESEDRISVVWQDPTSDAENILATFEP